MAEEIKNLIEKIQREGVQAADEKAKTIESEARRRAQDLLAKASSDAERIISGAKKETASIKESVEAALTQSGRDMLIALKKEMTDMLMSVAKQKIGEALDAGSLVEVIKDLIKKETEGGKTQIVVTLRKEDLDRIEKPLFGALSAEARKGIMLKSSDEVDGGFLISYDSGKSCYDFTLAALANYISSALKPRLAAILERAAQG